MADRIPYFDIVKGVAILFVIIGHGTGMPLFIASFNMPLFFIIAGYFFSKSIDKASLSKILLDKFNQLYVPVIICGLFQAGILILTGLAEDTVLHTFYGYHLRALWFLRALFFSICVISLCYAVSHDNTKLAILFLIISIAVSLFPDIAWSARNKFSLPFVCLGFLSERFRLIERFKTLSKKMQNILCLCAVLLFSVLLAGYESSWTIYERGVWIFSIRRGINILKMSIINVYRFLIGVVGSVAIMGIVRIVCEYRVFPRFLAIMEEIGKHTFGIYIVHINLQFIFFSIITPKMGLFSGGLPGAYQVLYVVVMLVASYYTTIWAIKARQKMRQHFACE